MANKKPTEIVSVLVPKELAHSKSIAKRILAQAGYTSRYGLTETPNHFRAPQSDQDATNFKTSKRRVNGLRVIKGELL